MASRRRLLSACVALLTAGCATRPSTGATETGETNEGVETDGTGEVTASRRTPTLDCADVTVRSPPKAVVSDDDVTPPSYPTLPDTLDADSVASFVSAYETAYAVNELLAGTSGVDYVDVAVSDAPPVTRTSRGYVADLAYRYAVEAETPADYPPRHVAYLVREGVVARVDLGADEEPVPFPVAKADVYRCLS